MLSISHVICGYFIHNIIYVLAEGEVGKDQCVTVCPNVKAVLTMQGSMGADQEFNVLLMYGKPV